MRVPTEILVLFFLISFFIYTMPLVLVKFSRTLKGKLLLILLTIVMTLHNRTAGLLMAMLVIFLAEFNYELNNGIMYEGIMYEGMQTLEGEEVEKNKTILDQITTFAELIPQNTRN
jgi:hypothetical protein